MKFIVFVTLVGVTFSLSVLFIKVSEQRDLSNSKEVQVSKKTLNALDCYVCEKLSWNQEYAEDVIGKNGITTFYSVKEEIDKRKRIEEEKIEEERRLARLEDERIKEEQRQAEIAEQKRQEEIDARLAEEKKKRDAEKEKQKKQEIASRGNSYKGVNENLGIFNVSWYGSDCVGCSGITASGVSVKNSIYYNGYGIAASDWNVIPPYSIIEVQGYGRYIVLDKGGSIKNRKLDLLTTSEAKSYEYGRQNLNVTVLRWGK